MNNIEFNFAFENGLIKDIIRILKLYPYIKYNCINNEHVNYLLNIIYTNPNNNKDIKEFFDLIIKKNIIFINDNNYKFDFNLYFSNAIRQKAYENAIIILNNYNVDINYVFLFNIQGIAFANSDLQIVWDIIKHCNKTLPHYNPIKLLACSFTVDNIQWYNIVSPFTKEELEELYESYYLLNSDDNKLKEWLCNEIKAYEEHSYFF